MPLIPEAWEWPLDVCSPMSIIEATMYYPSPRDLEKRQKIACFKELSRLHTPIETDKPDVLEVTRAHLTCLNYAREFEDFSQTYEQRLVRGFYAAHWLSWRLYAAQSFPAIGSNNRWLSYVIAELHENLPDAWKLGIRKLREARTEFGPVAHIWLAWFDQHHDGLDIYIRKIPRPYLNPWNRPLETPLERLRKRANAYFESARSHGLYSGKDGMPALDAVWQIGSQFGASSVPEITAPDPLVRDFCPEKMHKRYSVLRQQTGEEGMDDIDIGYKAPLIKRSGKR